MNTTLSIQKFQPAKNLARTLKDYIKKSDKVIAKSPFKPAGENPTYKFTEERLRSLLDAESITAIANIRSARFSLLRLLAVPGAEVLYVNAAGEYNADRAALQRVGITAVAENSVSVLEIENKITANTAAVFVKIFNADSFTVVNLPALAYRARQKDIALIADNSENDVATLRVNALNQGADFAFESVGELFDDQSGPGVYLAQSKRWFRLRPAFEKAVSILKIDTGALLPEQITPAELLRKNTISHLYYRLDKGPSPLFTAFRLEKVQALDAQREYELRRLVYILQHRSKDFRIFHLSGRAFGNESVYNASAYFSSLWNPWVALSFETLSKTFENLTADFIAGPAALLHSYRIDYVNKRIVLRVPVLQAKYAVDALLEFIENQSDKFVLDRLVRTARQPDFSEPLALLPV